MVYVIIAENGEHGVWSVTSHSSRTKAIKSLKLVADNVIKEMASMGFDKDKVAIEINEDYGWGSIECDGSIVHISIHETEMNSSESLTTLEC